MRSLSHPQPAVYPFSAQQRSCAEHVMHDFANQRRVRRDAHERARPNWRLCNEVRPRLVGRRVRHNGLVQVDGRVLGAVLRDGGALARVQRLYAYDKAACDLHSTTNISVAGALQSCPFSAAHLLSVALQRAHGLVRMAKAEVDPVCRRRRVRARLEDLAALLQRARAREQICAGVRNSARHVPGTRAICS